MPISRGVSLTSKLSRAARICAVDEKKSPTPATEKARSPMDERRICPDPVPAHRQRQSAGMRSRVIALLAMGAMTLTLLVPAPTPVHAQQQAAPETATDLAEVQLADEQNTVNVVGEVAPSVVAVRITIEGERVAALP